MVVPLICRVEPFWVGGSLYSGLLQSWPHIPGETIRGGGGTYIVACSKPSEVSLQMEPFWEKGRLIQGTLKYTSLGVSPMEQKL